MADEKNGEEKRLGSFYIGERYPEVKDDMGRLYEARHASTGEPALLLRPPPGVLMQLDGTWEALVSCQQEPDAVTLRVRQAPESSGMARMTDLFVLLAGALQRVEDNPRVDAHIMSGRWSLLKRWVERLRGGPKRNWQWRAVAGLSVLCVGTGLWLHFTEGARDEPLASRGMTLDEDLSEKTSALSNGTESGESPIAYPLPEKPFKNQAMAPCNTKSDEVDINGGCWMELPRQPPCAEKQAEHKGKCYIPVAKAQTKGEPRSIQP